MPNNPSECSQATFQLRTQGDTLGCDVVARGVVLCQPHDAHDGVHELNHQDRWKKKGTAQMTAAFFSLRMSSSPHFFTRSKYQNTLERDV